MFWLCWKQKAIKIIANFAADTWAKKGIISCREIKNCYIT